MLTDPLTLLPELATTIRTLTASFDQIPHSRIAALQTLSTYLRKRRRDTVRLNFICTHNSRRSHLAMVWAATAAARYGYADVQVFSGGTEATAFYPAAVAALERAGFYIERGEGENPRHLIRYSPEAPALLCYSKRFNHPANPDEQFAAVMVCTEADASCPLVPGAECRIPLPFEDPKVADGRPDMDEHYDAQTRLIGREILYAFAAGASPFLQWPKQYGLHKRI